MSPRPKPWTRLAPADRIEAVRSLEAEGHANGTIAFRLSAPRPDVDRICAMLRRERQAAEDAALRQKTSLDPHILAVTTADRAHQGSIPRAQKGEAPHGLSGLGAQARDIPRQSIQAVTDHESQSSGGLVLSPAASLGVSPAGRDSDESPATNPVANVGEEQNGATAACSGDPASRGPEVLIASSPWVPGFTGEDDGRAADLVVAAQETSGVTHSREGGSETRGGLPVAAASGTAEETGRTPAYARRGRDGTPYRSGVTGGESAAHKFEKRGVVTGAENAAGKADKPYCAASPLSGGPSPSDGDAIGPVKGAARLPDAIGVEPSPSDQTPAAIRQVTAPSAPTSSRVPVDMPERQTSSLAAPARPSKPWRELSADEKRNFVEAARKAGLSFGEVGKLGGCEKGAVAGVCRFLQQAGRLPVGPMVAPGKPKRDPSLPPPKRVRSRAKAKPSTTPVIAPGAKVASSGGSSGASFVTLSEARPRANPVADMVAEFVARNGVRRFERGASTDIYALRGYLQPKGYDISFVPRMGGVWTITGPGLTRRLRRDAMLAFVDGLRAKDGLPPFLPTPPSTEERVA